MGSTALTGAHEDIQRISSGDNRVTVTTVTPENAQHFLLQSKRVSPRKSFLNKADKKRGLILLSPLLF